MKRKVGQQSIETHNLSSRQFPAGPGSDLGFTNAIPFNEADDVDFSGGRQSRYCLGRGDNDSNESVLVEGSRARLVPASNPRRSKPGQPPWMEPSSNGREAE